MDSTSRYMSCPKLNESLEPRMIRIAIATVVVGGAIAASACFFTCGTQSANAGTSQEVSDAGDSHCDRSKHAAVATAQADAAPADASDPNCDKADCPPEHCDRNKASKVAAAEAGHADCDKADCPPEHCDRARHTTVAADAAPADGEDTPCHGKKATSPVVLASVTKVIHVENATCGSCIVPIREQLTQLAGIASVDGGEDFKDVIVTLAEDSTLSDAQLIEAVKKAGYTATIKAPAAAQQS